MDHIMFRITWADETTQEEFGVNKRDIEQFCARCYPGKQILFINEI